MANAMDGTRELARRCYFTFQAISLATFSVFIFENFNFLKTKWNVFFCRFQLLTFSFHAALSPCLPLFFGLSVFASRRLQLRPYRTLQPTLQFKDMEKLDLLFARVFDCNFDSPIVRLGLCVVLFHVIGIALPLVSWFWMIQCFS